MIGKGVKDMDILIVMCIGILVGRLPLLRRMKKKNEGLSLLCTFLLIFAMGVMLGEKENFHLWDSQVFCSFCFPPDSPLYWFIT